MRPRRGGSLRRRWLFRVKMKMMKTAGEVRFEKGNLVCECCKSMVLLKDEYQKVVMILLVMECLKIEIQL